jgi:hypothetical protein
MPRVELTRLLVEGLVDAASGDFARAAQSWTKALELGVVPEVGFEALLPAFVGWSAFVAGDRAAALGRLAASALLVEEVECPALGAAVAVLRAAIVGEAAPELEDALLRSSSDLRRVVRWASAGDGDAPLRVASDGRSVTLPNRSLIELGRRAAPRRLLIALVRARLQTPGSAILHDDLVEAGWPGERMQVEAARKRLRTAIWTLRKLGLEPVILTRDDGYLLDPLVAIEWSR